MTTCGLGEFVCVGGWTGGHYCIVFHTQNTIQITITNTWHSAENYSISCMKLWVGPNTSIVVFGMLECHRKIYSPNHSSSVLIMLLHFIF